MTEQEKFLLIKDLSARLPYQPYILIKNEERGVLESITVLEGGCFAEVWWDGFNYDIEKIKPYLRPMSSMTEEEKKEYKLLCDYYMDNKEIKHYFNNIATIDWYYQKYFDCRGLIKLGLALEAPEGMYK